MTSNSSSSFGFSATLFVAMISGCGYLAAFLFKYAYLSFFNVPSYFVEVGLTDVLKPAGFLLFISFGYIVFAEFILSLNIISREEKIKQIVVWLLFSILILAPGILLSYDPAHPYLFMVGVIVNLALLTAVTVMKFYRKHLEEPRMSLGHGPLYLLRKEFGRGGLLLSFLSLAFLMDSYFCGSSFARNQKVFLVVNTAPSYAIIESKDNFLIGVRFVGDDLLNEVAILSMTDASSHGVKFSPKEIGPLKNRSKLRISLSQFFFREGAVRFPI
jgi:hypothetical protein